jgi:DNA polymerase elongation subunit (family B)
MRLFAYDWFYNGYTVCGHCLNETGGYVLLRVRDFHPFCYVEGDTIKNSTVAPIDVEHTFMSTSRDISTSRPFCRVYFDNATDMARFSMDNMCYMDDVSQVSVFLSQIGADHVGWVDVPYETTTHCLHREPSPCEESKNLVHTFGPREGFEELCVNTHDVRGTCIAESRSDIPYSNPRTMAFDIEVKSSDDAMPQPSRLSDTVQMISVIGFGGGADDTIHILHAYDEPLNLRFEEKDGESCAKEVRCRDELDLIKTFFRMIAEQDPTVITGYNIYGFDLHYLVSRLRLRLVKIPDVSRGIAGSVKLIKVDWSSDAYGHNKYDRLVIGGRVILDMYLYFKRMKLDKYSLNFVSGEFLGEHKDDMSYAEMAEAFHGCTRAPPGSPYWDTIRRVAKYCIKDSLLVKRLFEKVRMWIDACEVSKITCCRLEDIYTRGEQMKMVSQCVKECTKRGVVLQPLRSSTWKQYEGGYVLDPKKGVYDGCTILDFQSLYPSIMIAYNICPSTYTRANTNVHAVGDHRFKKEPKGLIPGMIERLLEERKAVKTMMACINDPSSVEYIVLDRRQNALKVCANSAYGLMGFKKSRYFGHVGCAESVTAVGRQLLANVVQEIERMDGVSVIYGDTDSCMLWHNGSIDRDDSVSRAESICTHVNAMLPKPMALKFEAYCDKVVLLTKKRYVTVSNGRVRYRGVMNARRDYCKFAKDTYSHTIEMIATGAATDDIKRYVDDRMIQLMCGQVDTHELVITKSLAKRLADYKVNQPHVVLARRLAQKTGVDIPAGTRLNYVFAKGPVSLVTPEEMAHEGMQIDRMSYVKKQIRSQLDELLFMIGLGDYICTAWLNS